MLLLSVLVCLLRPVEASQRRLCPAAAYNAGHGGRAQVLRHPRPRSHSGSRRSDPPTKPGIPAAHVNPFGSDCVGHVTDSSDGL
jgi:hypothetical protein